MLRIPKWRPVFLLTLRRKDQMEGLRRSCSATWSGGLGLRSFAPSRLRRQTSVPSAFLGEPPSSRVRNRTARRAAYRGVASLKKPSLRLLKCVDYAQAFASNLQRDWNITRLPADGGSSNILK